MKTIILCLDNDWIYVSSEHKLSYGQSNLNKASFRFEQSRAVLLEAEQTAYNIDEKLLKVRVVNYSASFGSQLSTQPAKYPINKIEFEQMDWEKFVGYVMSFTIGKALEENFINVRQPSWATQKQESGQDAEKRAEWERQQMSKDAPNLFHQKPRVPFASNVQIEAKVKFEEATFGDGQISFKAKLKDYRVVMEFVISNAKLKKEFENVKPWFVKKIGKSFKVIINLSLVDGQVQDGVATSQDIDGINDELIDSIKTQRVLMLVKKGRQSHSEKVVFDNDEIFGVLNDDDGRTNVFGSSANNILQILMDNGLAKNIKQLEYLSKDKQSLNEKLRFTLKPQFGFLFKTETETKQFFIWELLNSNATYVWEKERTDLEFYQLIEHEISLIQTNGREEYRRYYKALPNKSFRFQLIEHTSSDLTEEERFQSWRNKLKMIIPEPK